MLPPDTLKASWLEREAEYSAFVNGPLLDFWSNRDERTFQGTDDVTICYVQFTDPAHDKVLVISSGRSESYVKYPEVLYDFFHLGFDVFIMDHRGQGLSGRMLDDPQKGHVERFDDYIDDFSQFTNIALAEKNYAYRYALAHSMGGAILGGYLLREPDTFRAAVLCAPMFGINLPMPMWLANMIVNRADKRPSERNEYAVSTGKWQPLPFLINMLTHSYPRYRRYLRCYADYPALRLGGPTYHWLRESIDIGQKIIAQAGEINTPLMVLMASEDKVVDNRELLAFCEKRRKARTGQEEEHMPLTFEGAYHEILFEEDALRAVALNAICHFFGLH